jgi:hypothetical protein
VVALIKIDFIEHKAVIIQIIRQNIFQVFKVDPSSLKVTMTLGARGIPGSDKSHFCKVNNKLGG